MASLPAKFRMLEIERYRAIGCPRIHLRLYSMIMRAHGLDEAHMVIFSLCPWVVWHNVGLLHWMYHATRLGMIWPRNFWDNLNLTLSLMFQGESWRLWGKGQRSQSPHLSPVGGRRFLRLLIGHLRGIRLIWSWGACSLDLLGTWWDSVIRILDLWYKPYTA